MDLIEQPHKGRWNLSRDGVKIGMVRGDYAIGFTAIDQLGRILGPAYLGYATSSEAIDAVRFVADVRDLEVAWLMTPSQDPR